MEEFDLRKIFQVFYKRKTIIFLVVVISVVIALVLSLLSPKIYEATGTMLVQEHMNEGSTRVKVDPSWYVNTQMELMKSSGVLIKVAKMWITTKSLTWDYAKEEQGLGSKKKGGSYKIQPADRLELVGKNKIFGFIGVIKSLIKRGSHQSQQNKIQTILAQLKEKVKVTNKFGSNVFFLSVETDDPKLSAALVNAIMVTYREENLRLKKAELMERLARIEELWTESQYIWNTAQENLKKFISENATLLNRDFIKEKSELSAKLNNLEAEKKKLLSRFSPQSMEVKNKIAEINVIKKQIQKIDKLIQKASAAKEELIKKKATTEKYKREFEKIDSKKTKLKTVLADLVSDVQISDFATPPEKHIKPKIPVNVAIAFVASLMFSLALAFFLEFISRKIKNEADLQKATGSRVFTKLPKNAIQSFVSNVRGLPEEYRLLRTSIMASLNEGENSILLTGTQKENDNTPYIAANLALAFSLLEERQIILVDADLRNPRCHEMFGMDITYGLVDYLIGALKDLNAKGTTVSNLKVVTVGQIPPNPAELLESKKMKEVVKMLEKSSDIVIYCSSSIAKYPDASVLATLTHKTLLTATVDETSIEDIVYVKDILQQTKAKIMGSVLCDII